MKEKLSLVGVLIIIAGVAFATARLAWSPKGERTTETGSQVEEVAQQPGPVETTVDTRKALVRCVVGMGSEGQEKIAWYPAEEGCPELDEVGGDEGTVAGEKVETETVTEELKNEDNTSSEPVVDMQEPPVVSEPVNVTFDSKVTSPTAGQALTSPFTVQGESRLKEVHIHVTNKAGIVLIHEHAPVRFSQKQEWGTFTWKISYEFSGTKEGHVVVLPEDDDPTGGVKIPVTF